VDTKIAGGILLIVGTSIGGGMLALPMVTAELGFFNSTMMLVATWAVMTTSALLMMEVNLWFPSRNNIITMAKETLGQWGALVAWISYLLLLYALMTAYVSGGVALFDEISGWFSMHLPLWLSAVLFILIFGYIVIKGIKPVDYVNRLLMLTKLGSLFLLIFMTFPYLKLDSLTNGRLYWMTSTITVMLTSFGFANIIPSLRSYFNDDVKKLRLAVLIGSLIPLTCYILWNFVILGTLPREGEGSLTFLMAGGGSATDLSIALSHFLKNPSITVLAHLFTVICILTAFLSCSLGLVDFLSDGLKAEKSRYKSGLAYGLTFLPPLGIVLFKPGVFIQSFSYAGICAIVLVVLLPALMAWSGRYRKHYSTDAHYQVMGGKWLLSLIMLIALIVLVLSLWNMHK